MLPSDFTKTVVETPPIGFLKTFYYKDTPLLQVRSWDQQVLWKLVDLRLERHAETCGENPFEVRSSLSLALGYLTHMIPCCLRDLVGVAEIVGTTPELYISTEVKKAPLFNGGGSERRVVKSASVHNKLDRYMMECPYSEFDKASFCEARYLSRGIADFDAAVFNRFAYSLGFTRQSLKQFTGDYHSLAALCRFAISYYVGTGRNAKDKESAQRMRKCFHRVINMDTYVSQWFFDDTSHKYMADLDAGLYDDVPEHVLLALLSHDMPGDDDGVMEFMKTLEIIKKRYKGEVS